MTQIGIRSKSGLTAVPTLQKALDAAPRERLLFICPHDDDGAIGAGMLIAQACQEGFDVHIGIATDGRMGYCSLSQKRAITQIRLKETLASYKLLGVSKENIHFLGFPDCSLCHYIGRRSALRGDPAIKGFTGLQNSFTWLMRHIAPQRVFTPASTDLHPDHQAVYTDLMISIFHANGDIWPELGTPCALPEVYEYPIYVCMDGEPAYMLAGDADLFDKKLEAIGSYVSQRQIKACVAGIRMAGAVEFFRNVHFAIYNPSVYKHLFERQ